jgi:hypothetical protein
MNLLMKITCAYLRFPGSYTFMDSPLLQNRPAQCDQKNIGEVTCVTSKDRS